MNILAKRTIQYRTDSGAIDDVVLSVFEPFQEREDRWRCGFQVEPPTNQRVIKAGGSDCIAALLGCLTAARGYIEHPTESRTAWQGMPHSGLPWHGRLPDGYRPPDIPPPESKPGDLDVLATRRLGLPDDGGGVRALILTVYRPFSVEDGSWKCAFALETTPGGLVRYGVGADLLEALLDALAMARVAYLDMAPPAWEAPEAEGFQGVEFLPCKIGRAYLIDSSKLDADA